MHTSSIKAKCIGTIADEKNNFVYWFVIAKTPGFDDFIPGAAKLSPLPYINLILRKKIVEDVIDNGQNTNNRIGLEYVFVDLFNVLGFFKFLSKPIEDITLDFDDILNSKIGVGPFSVADEPIIRYNILTGINIIDDMLFFTNNISEPKKINITRSILGTKTNNTQQLEHTRLFTNNSLLGYVKEEHVTVIKKAPKYPLVLEMDDGVETLQGNTSGIINTFEFPTTLSAGDILSNIRLEPLPNLDPNNISSYNFNIQEGDILIIDNYSQVIPITPINNFTIKVVINNIRIVYLAGQLPYYFLQVEVLSVDTLAVLGTDADNMYTYVFSKFLDQEKVFEYKFPRFAYRYKYEDGEYSSFSPFSEIAFLPGNFDYHPRKGYNLGMTNRLINLYLKEFVTEDMPLDVVSIDLLYKESDSNNVYVIKTLYKNQSDVINDPDSSFFYYNNLTSNVAVRSDNVQNFLSKKRRGRYKVNSEAIYALLSSNQLLRPFDNVPVRALAQEVSGNRIIYGNYLQNRDLINANEEYEFNGDLLEFLMLQSENSLELNEYGYYTDFGEQNVLGLDVFLKNFSKEVTTLKPHKSLKSIRQYQVGVVYLDEYGRETPVLTTPDSSVKISKQEADKSTQLAAKLQGLPPSFAKGFKFYVKETSSEYYNLAMDRFYDAEDGNIWLAFPSADRNKVDEETFLILKKTVDSSDLVSDQARYKIIAIENEAPDYIKIENLPIGVLVHTGVGTSDTNVFGTTASNFPTVTQNTFALQSKAFQNTSSQNLIQEVNQKNSKIYVRFENTTTNQKTKDYEITALTNGSAGFSGNTISTTPSTVQFAIKEKLTTDIEFILDDPTSPTAVKVDTNVIFTKKQVKNSPKFNGRFFVKIYNDAIIQQNITSTSDNRYSVVSERKFYFLSPDHVALHSDQSAGPLNFPDPAAPTVDWHTSFGVIHPNANLVSSIPEPYSDGDFYMGTKLKDFWYTFTSFFRVRNDLSISDRATTAGEQAFEDVWYVDGHASAGTYFSEDHTNASSFPPTSSPLVAGSAKTFIGEINEGTHQGMGITNYSNSSVMEIGFGGLQPDPLNTDGDSSQDYYQRYANEFFQNSSFSVPQQNFDNWWASPSIGQTAVYGQDNNGLGWTKGSHSIYSFGDKNSNYKAGIFDQQSFVKHLKQGMKFRWKEDPDANVYTVMGVTDYYVLRYDVIGKKHQSQQARYHKLRPENYQKNWRLTLDRPMVWNPIDGTGLDSSHDPMNGFSPNSFFSEKADSTLSGQSSAIGYTIQILEPIYDDNVLSENPAVWETQPKENVGLDVYYEASKEYPIKLDNLNISSIIKIGSTINFVTPIRLSNTIAQDEIKVIDAFVEDENVIVVINNQITSNLPLPYLVNINDDQRSITYSVTSFQIQAPDANYENGKTRLVISNNIHNSTIELNWFNCYSFGNGVESNRIEDNFNKIFIDNGAVASTTTDPEDIYKKDRRKNGLIFSGLYNSTSSVNNLNQFIQAEPITKEINPNYGSIQKLFSRSTASGDLIVFCEDKVLKVLADKDALFNADGNANLTASTNVLGQAIPFVGDYGISKNPESFASESYRAYFTDKQRSAVLRLSMDGITPISEYGMSDWFKDNLQKYNSIIGSYDENKNEYNVTLKNDFGFAQVEDLDESGPDVIPEDNQPDVINDGYNRVIITDDLIYLSAYTISYSEKVSGWVSFKSFIPEMGVSCANKYLTFNLGDMYLHHPKTRVPRNTFYWDGVDGTLSDHYTQSSITFVFNQEPSIIKDFKTLNYEGTKSRTYLNTDPNYINLNNYQAKNGWYAKKIQTDKDSGEVKFFVEKEGKWFNYIKANKIILSNKQIKNLDTSSIQGLGFSEEIIEN